MKEIEREKERLTALNTIDYAMMDEIKGMESVDPLSSKSDLIVKHVKYIRRFALSVYNTNCLITEN